MGAATALTGAMAVRLLLGVATRVLCSEELQRGYFAAPRRQLASSKTLASTGSLREEARGAAQKCPEAARMAP